MPGILFDANVQGHGELLVSLLRARFWRDLWDELNLEVRRFAEVGLPIDAPDGAVWETCQRLDLLLITDNRNHDDLESLEEAIRLKAHSRSLPVITLGDARRVMNDRIYAQRTAEALLEYLIDIESLRGTGRLYIP